MARAPLLPSNLGGWTLRCPLELNRCYLHHELHLAKAVVPNVNLRGSYLRSRLGARRLEVAYTPNLSGCRCEGGVDVRDARVGGQLNCEEATLS